MVSRGICTELLQQLGVLGLEAFVFHDKRECGSAFRPRRFAASEAAFGCFRHAARRIEVSPSSRWSAASCRGAVPGRPLEGFGRCTRQRIDAATPSPAQPDRADLGFSAPPDGQPRWSSTPLGFHVTCLLALEPHGDRAGVSPIVGTGGVEPAGAATGSSRPPPRRGLKARASREWPPGQRRG